MDWLKKAQDAFALIKEGREALTGVVDAVKDGRAAVQPGLELEDLQAMLNEEEVETRAAITNLRSAIAQSRT